MILIISIFFNVIFFLALVGAAWEAKKLETEVEDLNKLRVFIPDMSPEDFKEILGKQACAGSVPLTEASVIEETLRRR